MSDDEANDPELILEVVDDDGVLFDNINDYGCRKQTKNSNSAHGSDVVTENHNPKQAS